MKMIFNFSVIIALLLILGCATTNHNYFQTGKPSGKDSGSTSISLSAAAAIDYDIDDELGVPPTINIEKDRKWAPIIAANYNGGITEHADFGFTLGLSTVSINVRACSKICLFCKARRFGVGLLPAFNVSFTPDTLFGFIELPQAANVNFYLSLPVSYDLSDDVTLVFRPTVGREYSRITVTDDDDPEDKYFKSLYFNGRGLSVGMKIYIKKPDTFIFPEVSFITYDKGLHYIPFIGIAVSP